MVQKTFVSLSYVGPLRSLVHGARRLPRTGFLREAIMVPRDVLRRPRSDASLRTDCLVKLSWESYRDGLPCRATCQVSLLPIFTTRNNYLNTK